MTHLLRSTRAGRPRRDQRGFALAAVLFVVFLTSVLVVAVLGLSFATAGLSNVSDINDRQLRAADSALEATVNAIARDQTGNLGFPPVSGVTSDCSLEGETEIGAVRDEHGTRIRPGVEIAVECEALPLESGGTSPLIGVGQTESAGIRVVGSEYNGDRANWATLFPWQPLVGARASELTSERATLVHEGPAPLSLAGDVQVSQGAAGARSDAEPSKLTPLDAAIGVTGVYTQGLPGLLSDAPTYIPTNPSASCGVLDTPLEGFERNAGFGAIVRAGGGTGCNDVRSRASWKTRGITSPAPANWNATAIRDNLVTVTAGDCNQEFTPGAYDRLATQRLNSLFASCNNLLHFPPGDYWFDANSGGKSEITFANPQSRIIFGAVKSTGARRTFPEACDPDRDGVTITLSPRTSIRHTAGAVSICGRKGVSSLALWQSDSADLGWMPPERTIANPPSGGFTGGNLDGSALLDEGGLTMVATVPCTSGWESGECDGVTTRSVEMSHIGEIWFDENLDGVRDESEWVPVDPGDAPISAVQVLVKGTQSRADGSGSRVRVQVYTKGATSPLCQTIVGPLPDHNKLVAYDVLGPNGTCKTLLTDRSQLVGAKIAVHFDIRMNCLGGDLFCINGPVVELDYLALRVPWMPASDVPYPCNDASCSNAQMPNYYRNPLGWMQADDAKLSEAWTNCEFEFGSSCRGAHTRGFLLGVKSLSDALSPEMSDPTDPDQTLASAGLVLLGESDNVDHGASTTSVRVTTGSGAQCTVTVAGAPRSWLPWYINLLQGGCAGVLTRPSQLIGGSVLVTTNLTKVPWYECTWPFCSGWGAKVDYMGISTTVKPPAIPANPDPEEISANPYEGPRSPFLVTSSNNPDHDGSLQPDAVFGVFGRVELPRADVDVHWNGPYAIKADDVPKPGSIVVSPIFAGSGPLSLVVNGIGSSTDTALNGSDLSPAAGKGGQVGVLCCGPAKPSIRRVRLTARLNDSSGPILGTAVVIVSDQSVDPKHPGIWAPGQRIAVESWTLCSAEDRRRAELDECQPL